MVGAGRPAPKKAHAGYSCVTIPVNLTTLSFLTAHCWAQLLFISASKLSAHQSPLERLWLKLYVEIDRNHAQAQTSSIPLQQQIHAIYVTVVFTAVIAWQEPRGAPALATVVVTAATQQQHKHSAGAVQQQQSAGGCADRSAVCVHLGSQHWCRQDIDQCWAGGSSSTQPGGPVCSSDCCCSFSAFLQVPGHPQGNV